MGDIVACAGLGAVTGAVLISLGLCVSAALEAGRIEDVGWLIVIAPTAIVLSLFTAWPIGIAIGGLVMSLLGGGYAPAALSGALTGLSLAWLFGFLDDPFGWIVITILIGAGFVAGLFGWRAVVRGAVFNRRDWSRYA